ncbi:hypothetical protein FOZ61_005084 [Perkinsus olseni]|uniref:Uncharacterized protein n=1 Tax=Perkinsus olseni TaxID=32597 RepID=A0A7J6LI81_PEROL|nr:hypothetical protein FOZ61_005084 [Perkinsus olseni]
MSIRLKEFSHPENLANKIRLGMPPGEASTRSQVIGQDKPPISNPKPTGESIIREASQGNADSPDLGSLWPSSVTKRSSPGPRNGSPRTGDQNVQQLLPVRKEEASALNPEPKKKLIRLPVFSVSPSSAGETLPSGLARGGFPRASGDSAELRDQQKDTLKPKREPLAAVVSAPSGSLLHIDSLLPLPAPQRSPSGPGREGFPIVSGEAGKVRILRQGEPSALNDGSGTKSPLAEPGSSESGNLPELDVLLPPPVNSRSRVESVHAARPHKTVTGRSLGPAEDLQASMERGSLVKPSTHPQRPRSTALQSETDGARASKRQKTKHTASISHGLAERKPGKVRPHTENTGKHGGEKSDFGPTTSAIKARESASGGGHHGFGYSHKARFPTGAVGKPSGSSQVRSLRPGDEESNLETQLSIIDSEVPEWSTTPTETRGVGMVPDFGASLVPSNVTWSDLLSPEPGVSMTAPSGAGEERGELSIDEKLEMVRGGLLDFLDPDKQLRLYLVLGHLNILLKPALNATSQRPLRTPRQSNREMLHTHRKRSSEPKPASEPRNQDRHVKVAKKAPRITIGPPATATEAATKTDGPLLEPTQTKRPSRAAEYLVNYPDIDSRLPPSITKSALSRPTRRESRRASGESGQVELLRQGEPPNFNDESGEKSALIGPRGWESGDRPEFHAVSPPGVEHRSSLESANAAPHLMSPDGRGGGEPVADLLASLEGWVVKPSTQPQKPRSISVQPAADGTLASERQENSLAASISHGLAENKPGEELRYTENTGKRGSKPVDYGPKTTVSAVDPSGSASGGDLDGFGYLQKVDSTGAEGKASGTNEARSLRPSDEDTTLETQLSFIDGEIPEWSPTSAEKQDVEIDPDFDALFVSPNITWSDLLSAEPVAVPSGAGEESQDLSLDEKLAIEAQGLLDFLDSDKQ